MLISPDSYQCLVVFVPELQFTAAHYLVCAVPVVVVAHTAVVDDGGQVGVLVVVGACIGDISLVTG